MNIEEAAIRVFKVGHRVTYRGDPCFWLREDDAGTIIRITRRGLVVRFDWRPDRPGQTDSRTMSLLGIHLELTRTRQPRKLRSRKNAMVGLGAI